MIAFATPLDDDALIAEAANLYRELVQSEQRTVVNYWQFGRLVDRLRPKYLTGWAKFVKSQGWCPTRVKRAVRVFSRFERVEDCQDLTLVDALGYQEARKVLPPKTTVEEEHRRSETNEPQAPPTPAEPEQPPVLDLTIYREEDRNGDAKTEKEKEEVKTFDPWALDRVIQAELSRFTKDEIRKARDYLMSFDYPPRACDVLGYVLAAAVVRGKIGTPQESIAGG